LCAKFTRLLKPWLSKIALPISVKVGASFGTWQRKRMPSEIVSTTPRSPSWCLANENFHPWGESLYFYCLSSSFLWFFIVDNGWTLTLSALLNGPFSTTTTWMRNPQSQTSTPRKTHRPTHPSPCNLWKL
jgi:hypothetical protein